MISNKTSSLTKNESFYQYMFENNQEIFLIINPLTFEIEDCNLAACHFYGYAYEKMVHLKITDLNILNEAQIVREMNFAKAQMRDCFYFRHRRSDGKIRDVEVHSRPISLDGRDLLFSIVSDVTNSKIFSNQLKEESILLEKTVAMRTYELERINAVLAKTNATLDEANNLLSAILESSPEILIFALDRNYCYLSYNHKHEETMAAIWGKKIAIGMNMLDVIGGHDDRHRAKINFDRALAGESFNLIEEYGDESLSRLYWQDYWSPIYSNDGNVVGLTCFVQNITDRKRMEEDLQNEKTLTDALFNSAPGMIYLYDEQSRLVRFNKKHEELTGYSAAELFEMNLWDWYKGDEKSQKAVAEGITKTMENGFGDAETELQKKDGTTIPMYFTSSNLQIEGKQYFAGIGIDITERKKYEKELRESEARYKILFEFSGVAIGYYKPDGTVIDYNQKAAVNMGRQPQEFTGRSIYDLLSRDDADQHMARLAKASGSEISQEYEDFILFGSGTKWFSSTFNRIMDSDGHVAGVQIISQDITGRKNLEIALAQEKKLTETTLISIGDGVISCDSKGKVIFLNRVAECLTGWSQEEATGRPIEEIFDIINEFTREKSEDIVKKVLQSGRIHELANHTILIARDGIERSIEDSAAPIIEKNGEIVGVVLVFRDFSDKKQKQDEIEFLSYHDQLTGLYNRRFYETELARMDMERNLPLTIVMGDVNGLKLVNDSFGHAVGDHLLKKVADVIKKACRVDDIIARLGGDEFVIILPRTDALEAEKLIERIKQYAAKEKICAIDISISFGYDTKNKPADDIQAVFKSTEDRMYKNKLFESPSMRGKTISTIINTLHEKNKREEMHSHRVSAICRSMGDALGLPDYKIMELKSVGLLHDIGKIALDENLLNKNGKLSDDEWKEIKRHPEIGYRILSTVNDMSEMAEYVLDHHERWDGGGYPRGLKKEEISIQSRIISIADAFDAMTSNRAYGKVLCEEEAIDEIRSCSGTQFDPDLAKVFIEKVLGKVWKSGQEPQPDWQLRA